MTVHHFSTRELRDMASQITSERDTQPTTPVRRVTRDAHGIGNHWLVMTSTGRACTFAGCTYTDRYQGIVR